MIQSDHSRGFIAREFAGTLAESEVGHTLIRPHAPTENAFVERYHRTVSEQMDERELADDVQARAVIGGRGEYRTLCETFQTLTHTHSWWRFPDVTRKSASAGACAKAGELYETVTGSID